MSARPLVVSCLSAAWLLCAGSARADGGHNGDHNPSASSPPASSRSTPRSSPGSGPGPGNVPTLTVYTRNLYLGASLEALGGDVELDEDAVASVFEDAVASDPQGRMARIADEIAAVRPDVLALQEAALWRVQTPADGGESPATEVESDLLKLLLDALGKRGLAYQVAASVAQADLESTAQLDEGPADVRLTDRDVILVRRGPDAPRVLQARAARFQARAYFRTPDGQTVGIPRGWVAVDLVHHGRRLRLINTHLEAISPSVRRDQARELVAGPLATSLPVVAAGDFNFVAGTAGYASLTTAGLRDAWVEANGDEPGPTCCQTGALRNQRSLLDRRIDLVLMRGPLRALGARTTGDTVAGKTHDYELWPSDHAGVAVRLALDPPPPPRVAGVGPDGSLQGRAQAEIAER